MDSIPIVVRATHHAGREPAMETLVSVSIHGRDGDSSLRSSRYTVAPGATGTVAIGSRIGGRVERAAVCQINSSSVQSGCTSRYRRISRCARTHRPWPGRRRTRSKCTATENKSVSGAPSTSTATSAVSTCMTTSGSTKSFGNYRSPIHEIDVFRSPSTNPKSARCAM